ncbi:two-component system histidine kinase PnpS [Virgibacillus litoralis]|uniref:histidine kinase n=1 Tax=Virgibacillus litoralis TaxID=578221 RepID=A0ABS4HAT0_9BACI|nr:HAMP domain-containing sensor histidine kinase [Virgibacillus litoralis]MBP1947759.1 two-component system phosphate regulon sensor histidine kinase PhoR [Virgibacillus litoralis]
MKVIFSRPLFAYIMGLLILVFVSGAILSQLTNEYIILGSILTVEYIILLLIMLHVYDKYMKPIKKASNTIDELVKGNYRARIHHTSSGSVAELSNKINILARNLSEFAIQEQMQEKQLSTVIDNTQSGLVLLDEKGYIHLVNRKFISMFGGVPHDYNGFLYYEVLDNEKIHQTVQQTFLYEKNVKESFTQIIEVDKKYIEIVGAPIFNERNMLKGAVLVLYDITHLKKLELMRKDFVANVSHELKTPITSIKGFAETLLDGAMNDSETLKNFLTIINDESTRLQGLIEDLLTLSRLEKDEFKLVRSTLNMNDLVDEVLPIIRQSAEQKGISLTAEVGESISLQADKERVKQVVINLLTNAISYTSEDGEVKLTVTDTEDEVQIQVSDTGIGIDQEAIPRLFERFYRVDKARSRNTGGTGLGLAIVKHIVEVHEGKVSVDSEPNNGSTFRVYLPK